MPGSQVGQGLACLRNRSRKGSGLQRAEPGGADTEGLDVAGPWCLEFTLSEVEVFKQDCHVIKLKFLSDPSGCSAEVKWMSTRRKLA